MIMQRATPRIDHDICRLSLKGRFRREIVTSDVVVGRLDGKYKYWYSRGYSTGLTCGHSSTLSYLCKFGDALWALLMSTIHDARGIPIRLGRPVITALAASPHDLMFVPSALRLAPSAPFAPSAWPWLATLCRTWRGHFMQCDLERIGGSVVNCLACGLCCRNVQVETTDVQIRIRVMMCLVLYWTRTNWRDLDQDIYQNLKEPGRCRRIHAQSR